MPNVALYNIAGEEIGEVKLSEDVFGHEVNEAVLHTSSSRLPGQPASGHPVRIDPRRGQRRRHQALEAEGHRPCPSGFNPLSPVDSRRRRVCPQAQGLPRKRKQEGKARRHEERPLQQGKR